MANQLDQGHDHLLMHPPQKGTKHFDFFSLSKQKTARHMILPEIYGKKCFSSKGWIMAVGQDWSLSLLHPFSGSKILLPHVDKFNDWHEHYDNLINMPFFFISKFLVSSDPLLTPKDSVVMVIYGHIRLLAYWRPVDKSWNTVKGWNGAYFDIAYYKDKFYAINSRGEIMMCDIRDGDRDIVARKVATMPSRFSEGNLFQLYIVESAGALLVVSRRPLIYGKDGMDIDDEYWTTQGFKVFEVDLTNNKWKEIKDLGNRALFLGHNSSFSVETSDNSYYNPNSIYFTDDHEESYFERTEGGGKDTGIYNLKDGSITSCLDSKFRSHPTPPMWLEGNFRSRPIPPSISRL